MNGEDSRDEIVRLEGQIDELADRIESCRKFILIGRIAVAGGGVVLIALLVGANPVRSIGYGGRDGGCTRWHCRCRLESQYRARSNARIDCGRGKAEMHHDDYAKPLDIRWLCFVHHREFHGRAGNTATSH